MYSLDGTLRLIAVLSRREPARPRRECVFSLTFVRLGVSTLEDLWLHLQLVL